MYNTIPARPRDKSKKKKRILFISGIVLAVLIITTLFLYSQSINNNTQVTKTTYVGFDKSHYSTESADSIWVIVNKGRELPNDYIPSDLKVPKIPLRLEPSTPEMMLREDAAKALESMVKSANKEGIKLMLASGFRDYESQKLLYSFYVKNQGKESADSSSARAGFSEHQTGLAADLESTSRQCEVEVCFAKMPEGKWLATNAYKYGFVLRYQKDKVKVTGYEYEPWHFRYVGKDLAKQLYSANMTMEQFFGLNAVSDYSANPLRLKP